MWYSDTWGLLMWFYKAWFYIAYADIPDGAPSDVP